MEPDDVVFCRRDGSPRKNIRTAFERARKRAGLEDVRFHDLRHTAASRIVMGGGTLYDVTQHLGHRTLEMAKRYSHLSPGHMQKVADLTMAEVGAEVVELRRAR